LTNNPVVVIPLALGIFAPLIALVVMRPRRETTRATATFSAEVFVGVIVAVVLTQFAVMPALHWLGMRLP
jgi:hypothetical protein